MDQITNSPLQEAIERNDLIAYVESGCRPRGKWAIGTEHEKFGYRLSDLRPLPYDGPDGILAMLEGLQCYKWTPYFEGENVIALTKDDGSSVTLEPGGQFELSGAPLPNLHRATKCTLTLIRLRRWQRSWVSDFSASAFSRNGSARTYPGCPKGDTVSCANTCRPRAILVSI